MPIAVAILILLFVLRERRRALLWSSAVGWVLASTTALKLTFAACLPPHPLAVLHSPSGHTATAAIVYGGLAAVMGWEIVLTILQSLAVAGVIGVSRVMLTAHSPAEAVIGGGVGLLGAALLAAAWRPIERPELRRALAILVPVVVIALASALHGVRWSAEQLIRDASWRFWPLRACVG